MKLPELAYRTLIVGATGTGKSHLARRLVEAHRARRTLIVDPSGDWSRVLKTTPLRRTELIKWLQRKRPARVAIYEPAAGEEARDAAICARLAMEAQLPFESGHMAHRFLLVLEEAAELVPATRPPAPTMKAAILRGRHRGLDMMAISQRPSQVHADFRSNAGLRLLFPVYDPLDVRAIGDLIGREQAARLATLPKFHALAWRDGRVDTLAPA